MSDLAFRVDDLSKMYRIGHIDKHKTLRDVVSNAAKRPVQTFQSFIPVGRKQQEAKNTFWALSNVSFDIKRGEVVGFIGRNGAGKSTLLKILSRITQPTKGRVEGYGKVASLLEVGTGFHPELTGRENIYLNGAILGMTKTEITKKFDEIVAFAEIEKFLDTPVKRYSSGMYVKLAFAVAAHLEPDILIIDEVLAVGDIAFQKKCLGKMEDVANREGRTVLFVSHNMEMIQSLCQRAFLLDSGRVVSEGKPRQVIDRYLQLVRPSEASEIVSLEERQDRGGDGSAKIISVQIEDADGRQSIYSNSRLKVTIGYRSGQPIRHSRFLVTIFDHTTHVGIFALDSSTVGGLPEVLPPEGLVTCITQPIFLTSGRCHIELEILKGGTPADIIQYAAHFDVETYDVYGSGQVPERDWAFYLLDQTCSPDETKVID